MNVPAEVVEYDPRWPLWFAEIRARLTPYLAQVPHSIDHVGSTAVPGLAAKPIIDLDVVVPTSVQVPAAIDGLVAAGYQHEGDLGIAGREAFRMPADSPHHHHLYVVVEGNKAHQDHVLLRDHLRRDAVDRERYAALKRELAHLLATDRSAYVEAKAELVEELIDAARPHGSGPAADRGRSDP